MSFIDAADLAQQLAQRARELRAEADLLDRQAAELSAQRGILVDEPGHAALWRWFGLSRAAWLTLPRVLMHAMPDAWQARMAQLLDEYSDTWTNMPDHYVRVSITNAHGRKLAFPAWLIDYRHPDRQALEKLRRPTERRVA